MSEKVYIVVTKFFPRPGDWRCAYLLDFVKALKRRVEVEGCRSEVERRKVLVFVEGSGEDYEVDGAKVHTFKTRYLPSNIFPFLFKRFNQRSFIKKVEKVGGGGQWTLDDVVVCHGHTANYGIYCEAMKKANPKCKTLLHHHDLQSFGLNLGILKHCWLYNMIQFPILSRMHEKIDTHVFISEAARRSFLTAPDTSWTQYADYKKQMRGLPYRPVKIKNSIILHNGVDKSVFKEVEGCRSKVERRKNDSFVIGCVGNFSELKDQMTLLRAVARLKDEGSRLKVVFVGSGETLEECKRFAAENGLDVEFKSEVKHEQLAGFYRSLDLFVLPSTFEGFGCVYTEAHACGVPFIACEGQGVEDILNVEKESECGVGSLWLCKQRDPKDLAKKIEGAMRLIRLGWRSRSIADEIQPLNENQDVNKLVGRFVEEIGI